MEYLCLFFCDRTYFGLSFAVYPNSYVVYMYMYVALHHVFSLVGQRLVQERSGEVVRLEKQYKAELMTLKRDQKRELDSVHRKYANHREDLEKLQQSQTQLQVRA